MRPTRGGPSGLSPAGTPAASKQHRSGSTRRPRIVLVVGALLLAGADLGVKAAAVAGLSGEATVDLGLLNLRLYYNPGVAFSLGAAFPSWVIIAATGLIIAGLTWYLLSTAATMTRLVRAGAVLMLGGAAGNFLDRLDGNGVVDYLHTSWFPTFNLADVFVTTGVALLMVGTFVHSDPHPTPEE